MIAIIFAVQFDRTPIAFPLLPIILIAHILGGVIPFGLYLTGAISVFDRPPTVWIETVPFRYKSGVIPLVFGVVLMLTRQIFRLVLSIVALCQLVMVFGVVLIPSFSHAIMTSLAMAIKVIIPLVSVKEIWRKRENLLAFSAASFGDRLVDHSASLSLYLKLLSAGGEIDRFLGATLADKRYFTV